MNPTRLIRSFDPWEELRDRWPAWTLMVVPLKAGELWLWSEKIVLIPAGNPGWVRRNAAHVCGHLALQHDGSEWFSAEQESEASWWVRLHLDPLTG